MDKFSLKDEIKKLEDNPRRDLNIFALFLEHKKPDIRTKEQYQATLNRHIRDAVKLKPFDNDQIINAIPKAIKITDGEWTLNTIYKIVTK